MASLNSINMTIITGVNADDAASILDIIIIISNKVQGYRVTLVKNHMTFKGSELAPLPFDVTSSIIMYEE